VAVRTYSELRYLARGLENVASTLQKLGANIRDDRLPTLSEFGAVNRVILQSEA
jgi:aspartyl-tRNA(Asn)/glutamyl-tRNA(Gln) amidotransferase subunit A